MDKEMDDLLQDLDNIHYLPGKLSQRLLRFKALQIVQENELEGIHYLVESHAPGLRAKAVLRYEKILTSNNNSQNLSLSKDCIAFTCKNTPIEKKIQHMLKMVEEMPKEWRIVQLTPQFCPDQCQISDIEGYQTDALHISVFNCGKKQEKPVSYIVAPPRDAVNNSAVNLVQEMRSIVAENKSALTGTKTKHFSNVREREYYYQKRQSLDDRLKRIVKDIQELWLKELRCLLIGKCINESVEIEIRRQLRQFLDEKAPMYKVSDRIMNFLVCITICSSYLKILELKRAIQFCFPQTEALSVCKALAHFIRKLNEELNLIGEQKYPVILVIDDSLDCFPWEMMDVLCEESVSRIPSLHFAYALFKEHEKDIQNGFKVINDYNCGTYIVNPDLDLKNMEDRIGKFLQYWVPTWRGIVGKKPTEAEFENMLTSCNIFSYHGHGAGTQFFAMDKIQRIHVKAVVLLFGCGSTKLWEVGPQVEMYGAYQMYLIACSPCLIGMLWEVTDMDTDMLTTELLSQWLPSDANIHWKFADKTKWKKNDGIEFLTDKIPKENLNRKSDYEAELLKALSMSKKTASYYATKAAVIARGIPVKIII